MGNRVSIQFCDGTQKSAVLFDHWGGMERVNDAQAFVKKLQHKGNHGGFSRPLDRMEAGHVMVAYIQGEESAMNSSSCYLVTAEDEGDNGDNGHHIIKTQREDNP